MVLRILKFLGPMKSTVHVFLRTSGDNIPWLKLPLQMIHKKISFVNITSNTFDLLL